MKGNLAYTKTSVEDTSNQEKTSFATSPPATPPGQNIASPPSTSSQQPSANSPHPITRCADKPAANNITPQITSQDPANPRTRPDRGAAQAAHEIRAPSPSLANRAPRTCERASRRRWQHPPDAPTTPSPLPRTPCPGRRRRVTGWRTRAADGPRKHPRRLARLSRRGPRVRARSRSRLPRRRTRPTLTASRSRWRWRRRRSRL